MIKKLLLKYAAYFLTFALLALTEKALGVEGISVGFIFALLYCREKIYLTLPMYAAAKLLVSFSLVSVISVAVPIVLAVVVCLIHLKKRLKYTILETSVLTLAAMAPIMAFCKTDAFSIAVTALSVMMGVVFHYLSIVGMYPVLVRGLRYRLNGNEKFAIGVIICALSVGLGVFRPFNVGVFYFAAAFILMFARGIDRSFIAFLGVCMGLGASVGEGTPTALAFLSIIALICFGTAKYKSPVSAASMALGFCAAVFFFNAKLDLMLVIPLCTGCFCGMLLPKKFFDKLLLTRQGYQERFALRTLVNRDREDLSNRLKNVAFAFGKMQELLLSEQPSSDNPELIVKAVCETGCLSCPRYSRCARTIGDVAQAVRKLVNSALDNGKATLLDAGVGLGENCVKLSYLLNLTNDNVKQYRKMQERRSGIEQGKEMVISQMGGVARLLNSLAQSVNTGLTFDTEPEKLLIEKLGQANVVATDVCLYDNGDNKEITVVVRETDTNKSSVRDIVSEVAGCAMTEFSRAKDVKGMASLFFCRAPIYNVLYGETFSAKENRCGDTRQAVKIGFHKLMFILSDGMGTGREAYFTASHVIELIETFYKAGFDHKTVFTNVAQMLSLRQKEDFSALDVAIIDTQTAEIDFIKQGGRESLIFSGNDFEIIDGGTLPMGIIADSEPVIERRRLKPDDLVLMMSDGVADAINPSEIAEIIRRTSCQNPQNASDALITDALRLTKNKLDDMTVIALRLVRAGS